LSRQECDCQFGDIFVLIVFAGSGDVLMPNCCCVCRVWWQCKVFLLWWWIA